MQSSGRSGTAFVIFRSGQAFFYLAGQDQPGGAKPKGLEL